MINNELDFLTLWNIILSMKKFTYREVIAKMALAAISLGFAKYWTIFRGFFPITLFSKLILQYITSMNFFGHIFISSPGLGRGGGMCFTCCKDFRLFLPFCNEFFGSQNQRHLVIFEELGAKAA